MNPQQRPLHGLANTGKNMNVPVFDLGGGTFDVTFAEIRGKDISVVATTGDHQLGKDWDEALIQYISDRFQEKHGVDPLEDAAAYHDLKKVSAQSCLYRGVQRSTYSSILMEMSFVRKSRGNSSKI